MAGFPPMVTDEREQLLAVLNQQRALVRLATYGITDDQARRTPSASALSLGGIVKHLTDAERNWTGLVQRRPQPPGGVEDYLAQFRMGAADSLAALLERYAAVARDTDAAVRDLPLDEAVPVPKEVPWFPKDVDAWSVRWVVLHLIEETARHAGHADIVRESLDGATWIALMAAAEGWNALPPGVEPWTPKPDTPPH